MTKEEAKIKDMVKNKIYNDGPCYTRDLYLMVGGKKSGLSLNKFRSILNTMCRDRLINYTGGKLPKWY